MPVSLHNPNQAKAGRVRVRQLGPALVREQVRAARTVVASPAPGLQFRAGRRRLEGMRLFHKPFWPKSLWPWHPGVRSGKQLTLGERAADRMRNTMGSWAFVFSFFAFMAVWTVVNGLLHAGGGRGGGPLPLLLLGPVLSLL